MIKRLIKTAQIVIAAVFVAFLTVACNAAGGGQEAASNELTYMPQPGDFVLTQAVPGI